VIGAVAMARPFWLALLVPSFAVLLAGASKNVEGRGHALRHTEQSVVVLVEPKAPKVEEAGAAPPPPVAEPVAATVGAQDMLVGSMTSLLQSEQEVFDPSSPAAALRRELVSLIWLERVLQENLASMDQESYREKIGKSKAGVEKDGTPETAEMLSKMRTEMHEFSTPFFQDAVKEELKDIKARQEAVLDKIMAIESGKDIEADSKGESKESKEPGTKKKKPSDAPTPEEESAERESRKRRSSMFISIMVVLASGLLLVLLAIGLKVHLHQRSRATDA